MFYHKNRIHPQLLSGFKKQVKCHDPIWYDTSLSNVRNRSNNKTFTVESAHHLPYISSSLFDLVVQRDAVKQKHKATNESEVRKVLGGEKSVHDQLFPRLPLIIQYICIIDQ